MHCYAVRQPSGGLDNLPFDAGDMPRHAPALFASSHFTTHSHSGSHHHQTHIPNVIKTQSSSPDVQSHHPCTAGGHSGTHHHGHSGHYGSGRGISVHHGYHPHLHPHRYHGWSGNHAHLLRTVRVFCTLVELPVLPLQSNVLLLYASSVLCTVNSAAVPVLIVCILHSDVPSCTCIIVPHQHMFWTFCLCIDHDLSRRGSTFITGCMFQALSGMLLSISCHH